MVDSREVAGFARDARRSHSSERTERRCLHGFNALSHHEETIMKLTTTVLLAASLALSGASAFAQSKAGAAPTTTAPAAGTTTGSAAPNTAGVNNSTAINPNAPDPSGN